MPTRLDTLRQFYSEDPNDPFNIYALALELSKSDVEQARGLFEVLLTNHPDYIPTYYHAGKLYEELGEKNRAVEVLEKGIERATRKGELKAAREMRAVLEQIE